MNKINKDFISAKKKYEELSRKLNEYYLPKIRLHLKNDELKKAEIVLEQIPQSVVKSLAIDAIEQYKIKMEE